MFNINFANDWIRSMDLWCRKWPLYQLSHNHCPPNVLFLLASACLLVLLHPYLHRGPAVLPPVLRGEYAFLLDSEFFCYIFFIFTFIFFFAFCPFSFLEVLRFVRTFCHNLAQGSSWLWTLMKKYIIIVVVGVVVVMDDFCLLTVFRHILLTSCVIITSHGSKLSFRELF